MWPIRASSGVRRPNRQRRRWRGKSDPIDAQEAARAVLVGEAAGAPRTATEGWSASVCCGSRALRAVKARTQALNVVDSALVSAPDTIRDALRGLRRREAIARAARFRHDAALAALCGASPVQASSGKVVRHRLNRGGDRDANSALWRIVLVRMGTDARTRAYVTRRTAEGKSKAETMRVLRRYVARETYRAIIRDAAGAPEAAVAA